MVDHWILFNLIFLSLEVNGHSNCLYLKFRDDEGKNSFLTLATLTDYLSLPFKFRQ